jgi:hypothetical protein
LAIKASRDQTIAPAAIACPETSVVDAKFDDLNLKLQIQCGNKRLVSMTADEAAGAAGASLADATTVKLRARL